MNKARILLSVFLPITLAIGACSGGTTGGSSSTGGKQSSSGGSQS